MPQTLKRALAALFVFCLFGRLVVWSFDSPMPIPLSLNPQFWFKKATASLRSGRVRYARGSNWGGRWSWNNSGRTNPRDIVDYRAEVGDAATNSAVAACLGWITTSWPQAPAVVYRKTRSGEEADANHPLALLLAQPSPYYDGRWLISALLRDWWLRGNAYVYIVEVGGLPVELQYLPARLVTPEGDDRELITGYKYEPDGQVVNLDRAHVIHFRFGIDPEDDRRGKTPLDSAYEEIATDNEVTRAQFKLFRKGGVPPWIVGPDGKGDSGAAATIDSSDAAFIKAQISEGIDNGNGLIMPVGFKFDPMGMDPQKMLMTETQRKAEERIAAVFQIPPVVAGLGAGLDRSTFNNYEEARKAAWEDNIIPAQDAFAGEIGAKLLPYYNPPRGTYLGYDRSGIKCLQEDVNANRTTAADLYDKGVIDRAAAKTLSGFMPDPEDEGVYKSDTGGAAADPNALPADPSPSNNGTGKGGAKSGTLPFTFKGQAMPESDLYNAARRFRGDLLQREDRATSQMRTAYNAAARKINARLVDLTAEIRDLQERGIPIPEQQTRLASRYESLLIQAQSELDRLTQTGTVQMTDAQSGFAQSAAQHAESLTRAALGTPPAGVAATWNSLPSATLEAFVGFASDGSPLSQLLRDAGGALTDDIREALFAGVAAGDNPRTIGRQMAAQFGVSRSRFVTIARTETMRAAREASRLSYEANADVVDGWIWLSAADIRTCPACFGMHGSKHTHAETLDGHPQCRCVPIPDVKSWAEILGDPTITDDRVAVPSGEALFANLSEDDQRAILGPGGHALYQDGTPLSAFVHQTSDSRWGTMRRPSTLTEAATAGATV